MALVSLYSYGLFKDYVLEIFKNEWDKPQGYTTRRILELFQSKRMLSVTGCHEILDAVFKSEGGMAYESIENHFKTLKKHNIITRSELPSLEGIDLSQKYYRLTSFGVFYTILNHVDNTSFPRYIRDLIRNNPNDPLFAQFLYPCITRDTISNLDDYKMNYVDSFLIEVVKYIKRILIQLKQFKEEGGARSWTFSTRYFEDPQSHYVKEKGRMDFVRKISNIYNIHWKNIDALEFTTLQSYKKYQISDNDIKLILEVKPKKKIAIISTNNVEIDKLIATDEDRDGYYNIVALESMSTEEYYDKYIYDKWWELGGKFSDLDSIIEEFILNILSSFVNRNGNTLEKNSDLLLLLKDEKFKHIAEVTLNMYKSKCDLLSAFLNTN